MNAWKYTLVAVAVAIAALSSPAATYSPPAGTPLANREHPRIWLTKSTVAEINAKIAGSMKSDYQTFVSYLDSNWAGAITDQRYFYHIRNYAFVYAIGAVPGVSYGHSLTEYADKAKEIMLAAVNDYPPAQDNSDNRVISVSVGYDWIYSRLSASDRSTIVGWLRQVQLPQPVDNPFHQTRNQPRNFSMIAGLSGRLTIRTTTAPAISG